MNPGPRVVEGCLRGASPSPSCPESSPGMSRRTSRQAQARRASRTVRPQIWGNKAGGRPRWNRRLWLVLPALLLAALAALRFLAREDPAALRSRAESFAQAREWSKALDLWRRVNSGPGATGPSLLSEARACLALGRAAQAEQALRRAVAMEPDRPDAWLLLLKIFWIEDRALDVLTLGWAALEHITPDSRREFLRELTLAALTDVPDELARTTLKRWTQTDPGDLDALLGSLRRQAAEPRADDPDRETRRDVLVGLLRSHPGHVGVRETLIGNLADAGETEEGRSLLEDWPSDRRDGRYWRLRGRWELEYDRQPERAAASFRAALADFPHDWRTHYRLARALRRLQRDEEARREAETVSRIREVLDPMTLGPALEAAFAHLQEPTARQALAGLCARAGLDRLARAWLELASDEGSARPAPAAGRGARPGAPRALKS